MTDPAANNIDRDKAWEFFETKVLPRKPKFDTSDDGSLVTSTELYPVFGTDTDEIGKLGIGVALYFKQIIGFAAFCLIAGIITLYSTIYYSSNSYSSKDELKEFNATDYVLLFGSAVCSDQEKVSALHKDSGTFTTEDYISSCKLNWQLGFVDIIAVCALLTYLVLSIIWQDKAVAAMDISLQTAQDYSIMIKDPTHDATDPDEWHRFFSRFGPIAYITVAKNNGKLLRFLTERRKTILRMGLLYGIVTDDTLALNTEEGASNLHQSKSDKKSKKQKKHDNEAKKHDNDEAKEEKVTERPLLLSSQSDSHANIETAVRSMEKQASLVEEKESILDACFNWWKPIVQYFGFKRDMKYYRNVLFEQEHRIVELTASDKRYKAVRVFVTFQTEHSQRFCLKNLKTGFIPSVLNLRTIDRDLCFRGTNTLEVEESPEPSDVIWENLEQKWYFYFMQLLLTTAATALILTGSYYALVKSKENGSTASGVVISLINVILPTLLTIITSFEKHGDYGDLQNSSLLKLAAARFMNTAIINFMTTAFSDTLSVNALTSIVSILVADMIMTPIINLLDISGSMNRFVFSRFLATNQAHLNSFFYGNALPLAERYTNVSKTLFVVLFYSAIYPFGFFIAAITLTLYYWVDKYLIFRVWRRPPLYGDEISRTATGYAFFALLAHMFVTAYWFSGWPFDSATYDSSSDSYTYVDKNQLHDSPWRFLNAHVESYMTTDQKGLVRVYSFLSLFLLAFLGLSYFGLNLWHAFLSLFVGRVTAVGDPQPIAYTSVEEISAFIPMGQQSMTPGIGVLMAACTIDLQPTHLPDLQGASPADQNIALDIKDEADRERCMSVVKFYHPPKFEDAITQSVDPYSTEPADWRGTEASWLLTPFMRPKEEQI